MFLVKPRLAGRLLALVLICTTNVAALAQSSALYGGGSQLMAPLLEGAPFATGQLVEAPSPDSLIGAYQQHLGANAARVSYCPNGGDQAKRVFDGESAASLLCDPPKSSGIGAPRGIRYPAFVVSDLPLSGPEYTRSMGDSALTAAHVEPMQFPAVAASIAIVYNNSSTPAAALTDADLCAIFSGSVTDWNQLPIASPQKYPKRPLSVVYRADPNSTSFYLLNHLAAACNAQTASEAAVFQASTQFTPRQSASVRWVASDSESATLQQINSVDGAIGYVVAPVLRSLTSTNDRLGAIQYASVDGLDPFKGFGPVPIQLLGPDVTFAGADAKTGFPQTAPLQPKPTQDGCVFVANPASYASPTAMYPLVAVSYFLGYYRGNGPSMRPLRSLLTAPYNRAITRKVAGFAANTGYAPLVVVDAKGTPTPPTLIAVAVARCVNP